MEAHIHTYLESIYLLRGHREALIWSNFSKRRRFLHNRCLLCIFLEEKLLQVNICTAFLFQFSHLTFLTPTHSSPKSEEDEIEAFQSWVAAVEVATIVISPFSHPKVVSFKSVRDYFISTYLYILFFGAPLYLRCRVCRYLFFGDFRRIWFLNLAICTCCIFSFCQRPVRLREEMRGLIYFCLVKEKELRRYHSEVK